MNFVEINQVPSPCSILQHIGKVATPKRVPRHCLRYLQTTLMMGGRGTGLRTYVRYCGLNRITLSEKTMSDESDEIFRR